MKKLIVVLSCIFLVLTFSACDIASLSISNPVSPDNDRDNLLPKDGFAIAIERVELSASALGTIPGRNPVISAEIYPAFATERELKWSLHPVPLVVSPDDPADIATINQTNGQITVRTSAVIGDPVSAIIKVESVTDPSKYDTCTLTIFPEYPKTRSWSWSSNPGTTGDLNQGDGGTLLFGSGNGSDYTLGGEGAGVYVIDPADPYRFGVVPEGGARPAGTFSATDNSVNNNTYNQFLYPTPYSYSNHIRTSGSAARIMRIAALFAPFTVVVNYQSNDAGERNADIRIGDNEGLRIQGPASTNNNSSGAKTVWYSYDPTDPEKPEFEQEEFVPFVFVEANQGLRLYAVYVLDGVYEIKSGRLVPKL